MNDDSASTKKTFRKVDQPYFLIPRAGESRGELRLENEIFGKTRDELRELGVPEWFVKNHFRLDVRSGENIADWIKKRSGIIERNFAPPEQNEVELGVAASRDLDEKLAELGVEIDPQKSGLIFASATAVDRNAEYPARTDFAKQRENAREIARQLFRGEVEKIWTIENGCAGTGGMLAVANDIFRENPELEFLRAISAEKLSNILNRRDLGTTPLLGDAGGALLLARNRAKNTPNLEVLGDAHFHDKSKNGAGILHIGEDRKLVMDGRNVFRRATTDMPGMIAELAEFLEIDPCRIKLILPHLANARILKQIDKSKKNFGLPNAKIITELRGENTSSQTIMKAIEIAEEQKLFAELETGDLVAITTVGLGWHGRCVLFRHSN